MAYTQTDLDRIEAAIATGQLSVSFRDKTVTYRSIDDLIKVKREIKASLAGASSTTPKAYPRYQTASFSDD
ncbi:MAG: hypothetical protein AB2747_05330 [Candidatus Thiodiazotropha taylori]